MNEHDVNAPPNALDAERSVLGACLIDKQAVDEATAILRPAHFYQPAHQRIYGAVYDLWQRETPIDMLTVSELLRDRGQLDGCGGLSYLMELVDTTVTTANTEHYSRIVYQKALRRGLLYAANDIQRFALDEARAIEDVLADCERRILGVAERRAAEIVTASDVLTSLEHRIESGDVAVPYHLRDMTEATSGGMRRGWYTLVGGPSGGGKTRWLCGLVHSLIRRKRPQVVFSLEMSAEDLLGILLALELRINPNSIGKADPMDPFVVGPGTEDWAEVRRIVREEWLPLLYVIDTSGLSVDDMGAIVRRIQRKAGECDVHIDFAGLVSGRGNETLQRLEAVAAELATLYKTLSVRGVVLTQVTIDNGRAHARYGRDLEFYAQAAYYLEPPEDGSLSEAAGDVPFRNAKNRLGRRTGHCLTIRWNNDLATFEDGR